jgi:cystathionine gamma-synthase
VAEHAEACKSYIVRKHDNKNPEVYTRALDFDVAGPEAVVTVTLHAVFLNKQHLTQGMAFWRLTGYGISSRLAEDMLPHINAVRESAGPSALSKGLGSLQSAQSQAATAMIQQRISTLLERAPIPTAGPRPPAVRPDDVFLYPTGMAAIYHCTQALRAWPGTKTVVFGFPYELTLTTQQEFARACTFYGFGTADELDQLEDFLHMLAQQGRTIQAVWCECASNPLLRTVDLDRIRRLADRYGFLVVVDDTIGSFANVDLLGVADVIITSLTKSFSGYADVMGGSLVVNPRLPHHDRLHALFSASHVSTLYGADAIKLEQNSRGFLERAAAMNQNAARLVAALLPFAEDQDTNTQRTRASTTYALRHVYYPSVCWSAAHYAARMRPATPDFTPGHGGLFTLEFRTVAAAQAFFDALLVCKGPSLGANVTLAQPYVQTVFAREKAWAARYGLSETIVRISVGVEDGQVLEALFREAMYAAERAVAES